MPWSQNYTFNYRFTYFISFLVIVIFISALVFIVCVYLDMKDTSQAKMKEVTAQQMQLRENEKSSQYSHETSPLCVSIVANFPNLSAG